MFRLLFYLFDLLKTTMSPTMLSFRKIFLLLLMLWLYSEASGAVTTDLTAKQADTNYAVRINDSLQIIRLINYGLQEIEDNNSTQARTKFLKL